RLGHVRDDAPRQFLESLLHRPDRVPVEVGRALLELREVLDGAQAAFGAVDLLIEYPPQAGRVQAEAAVLRADVGAEVELPRGVAIHVAVQAGYPLLRLRTLAVVGQVEL